MNWLFRTLPCALWLAWSDFCAARAEKWERRATRAFLRGKRWKPLLRSDDDDDYAGC
jgi:hypothetical protein